MKTKIIWKVWLVINRVSDAVGDYIAQLVTSGATKTEDDLIEAILGEGSDIHEETVRAVLDREAKAKKKFLLNGDAVQDQLFHYAGKVLGNWRGNQSFTQGDHKVVIGVSLTKEFRNELNEIGVEVLGIKGDTAVIKRVIDDETGLDDNTITAGEDIIIEGDKIKVLGLPQPDGSIEPGIGVFFTPIPTGTPVQATRIRDNNPTNVRVRVPSSLPKDQEYTLKIVTRYSNGTTTLNDPRPIVFASPVKTNE